MRAVLAVVVALVLALVERPARAHGSRTAYLEVTATSSTEAVATIVGAPALGLRAEGCLVLPSEGTRVLRLRCEGGVAGVALEVTGLREGEAPDLVVARLAGLAAEGGEITGAVLTRAAPRASMPGREALRAVLARFAQLGVFHVLSGADHVLFLLALFWQAVSHTRGSLRRAARELAGTATAFTLAHTLTLTTTALGLLRVPTVVAEACIAASLVLVALDLREGVAREGRTGRLGLAAAFGLVHGLGFASALGHGALPEHALALGLAAFNVGVEVAQALVLSAALVALALGRHALDGAVRPRVTPVLARGTTYVVGCSGAFLFFARLAPLVAARLASVAP